jgi:hypothetical protein
MTIDEAFEAINAAPKGTAQEVALKVVSQLDKIDRDIAAPDLEEMAVVLDFS